ncbi:type II toxin-antitoxin system antitoxin SocA domain-containing protein [Paenibacillus sp. GCM10027627]|uniref:type II toxin-antitoxin system antitoxin SocA domain-containing protein n=1 Tax=unclassified Paenibacillus TaxID=185978 RepID=UPI0036290254
MKYCDECNREQGTILQHKVESYTLHGKTFDVEILSATCEICGAEVFDEQVIDGNMSKIHTTYQELYGGLTVEEIREIRSQYPGLGKRPFAKLLNIGYASVGRYESESGAPMSSENLAIYRELKNNPRKIVDYYNQNKHNLSPRELKKTELIMNSFIDKESIIPDEDIIEKLYKPFSHTSLSGFREFDFEKFVNMILYFARDGVNKTKLMKLLWFSDFYHYRKQTVSISGAVYQRLQFGPVPKDHGILLAHLQHMDTIKIDEQHEEGWVRMEVRSTQEFDPTVLDQDELATLEKIDRVFESYGSRKISDYSHEERAWIETANEFPIDYNYAMSMREI